MDDNDRPNIATAKELRRLEATRKTPKPELTLEPGGRAAFRQKYEIERLRERRIDYLRSRLGKAREGLRRNVDKSFGPEK